MKYLLPLAAFALAFVLVAAGCGGDNKSSSGGGGSGGDIVFGGASDPVVLDGALVSDGESLRPINQMFEGLVGLRNGSTVIKPLLATKWKASKNGLAWTFALRRGVRFQDGTRFNAAAVCYNF